MTAAYVIAYIVVSLIVAVAAWLVYRWVDATDDYLEIQMVGTLFSGIFWPIGLPCLLIFAAWLAVSDRLLGGRDNVAEFFDDPKQFFADRKKRR